MFFFHILLNIPMYNFLSSSRYFLRYRFIIVYASILIVTLCCVFMTRPYVYIRKSSSFDDIELVLWEPPLPEVSCHTTNNQNALPVVPRNASFPVKSIFFHETSCRDGLTSRQACVVESAARTHPGHQINVLFTSSVSKEALKQPSIKTLLAKYNNIKLARVNIQNYAEGTPLSSTVNKLYGDHLNMYISKLMKYLSLYKYSGIYLGLDVLVARPFDDLWKNWVIRETTMTLSTDMLSFSENKVGRKLAEVAVGYLLSEIALNKKHDLWHSGPTVLTHVLQLWCTTNKVQGMSLSNCDDLAVYGPELFYPISFHNRAAYFSPVDWKAWKEDKIYTYHIWEYFTKYNIVTKFSLYGKIAKEYCPAIYNKFNDEFGELYLSL